MSLPRFIMHLDMDAFYASIEVRDHPEWVGKPVIVGYPGGRGVVSTCSYEARKFGVRSAMPSVTAAKLCPNAIWTPGRMKEYVKVSRRIRGLMDRVSPLVEPLSIDEAFIDLTGIAQTWNDSIQIAKELKQNIVENERITGSVGLSENKFLAKVASDLDKPDGLTVLPRAKIKDRLWPLPVRTLWGVGPKMELRLRELGVSKVGEILDLAPHHLSDALGSRAAAHLRRLARGQDNRPVHNGRNRKSISEERTYGENLTTEKEIYRAFLERSEGVALSLRENGLEAQTIQIKVRASNFKTWTRAATLEHPTDLMEPIFETALNLYRTKIKSVPNGIRLLGVGATQLQPKKMGQSWLFEDELLLNPKRRARAMDAVRAQLGSHAITRARLLDSKDQKKPQEASSLPAVDG